MRTKDKPPDNPFIIKELIASLISTIKKGEVDRLRNVLAHRERSCKAKICQAYLEVPLRLQQAG